MSIVINLTPLEEARLSDEATQTGMEASELVTKLLREHLTSWPVKPGDTVRARLREWQLETETDTVHSSSAHELFARWADEDAQKTDEEIATGERIWEDYQRDVDDERRKAGMRTLFGA